jgi:hypothetical protein
MKTWKIISIIAGVSVFLLVLSLSFKLIFNWSWWVVIGTSIFLSSGWLVGGIIFLIIKLTKKEPTILTPNLEDVEELVKYKMKHDEENPDNFIIEERRLWKIGEPESERTPIWVLSGHGSELMEDRVVLVNSKNLAEISFLINKNLKDNLKEILEEATRMAEHQPDIITREVVPGGGVDEFGRPIPTKVIVRSQSRTEMKQKEEEEEVEKKTAF